MSPVTDIVLVLILCYVGVSAVDVPITEAANPNPELAVVLPISKLGKCPVDVDYPICKPPLKPECNSDADCKGKSKCCFSACKMRCVLPLEAKVGVCPYFNFANCIFIKPLPSECHSDNQCQGTDRCCCFNCRHQCTPTVKPGQCPGNLACVGALPPPQCTTDNNCLGKKKCCDVCGMMCVSPQIEHPGVCKNNQENLSCITLKNSLCTSDLDCPLNQKCCLSGNTRQCEVALKVKPGICPLSPKCTGPLLFPLCQSDSECPGSKKCCTSQCSQECTDLA